MGTVISVSRDKAHRFSKIPEQKITLIAGLGVEGDAHSGKTVQHLSRVKQNPDQPNLRQVHLIHAELLDELRCRGIEIAPGEMGENILTRDIDLLNLPEGATLQIGDDAVLQVTGLRNPCKQLDRFAQGLMQAVLDRDENNQLIRKAGVMAIVERGGDIVIGDPINTKLPKAPHRPLAVV